MNSTRPDFKHQTMTSKKKYNPDQAIFKIRFVFNTRKSMGGENEWKNQINIILKTLDYILSKKTE